MRSPKQIHDEIERIERELTSVKHDLGWRGAMSLHPHVKRLISWALIISMGTAGMAGLAMLSNDVPDAVTVTFLIASCVSILVGSMRIIYNHEFSTLQKKEQANRVHLRREVQRLNTLLEYLDDEHHQRVRMIKKEGTHEGGELSLPAEEKQQGELTHMRGEDV